MFTAPSLSNRSHSSRSLQNRSLASHPVISRSIPSTETPIITSVHVPLFAAPSPPGTPKLVAETPILATTSRQSASSRQARAVRFSPKPPVSRSGTHMLSPDDWQSTTLPTSESVEVTSLATPPLSSASTMNGQRSASVSRSVAEILDGRSSPMLDSSSVSSDSLSEISSEDTPNFLHPTIKKPDGEVGRPGRGGYTLLTALAWDRKTYNGVRVRKSKSKVAINSHITTRNTSTNGARSI